MSRIRSMDDYKSRDEYRYRMSEITDRFKEMEYRYERRIDEMEMRYKEKYRRGDFSDMEYDTYHKLRRIIDEFEHTIDRKIRNIEPQKIDYKVLAKQLSEHSVETNVSELYKTRAMDISHIVFNVLHIIRTPLSGIIICNNSIINSTSDDEIKGKCSQVIMYTEMMENGLSSFASFQNIDDDNAKASLVNRLHNEVRLLLLTAAKKIDLSLDHESDIIMQNSKINCIMLCVSCIIENAMHYTQDNSKIVISLSKDSNENKLSIINFGEQIPDEYMNKIFDEGFSTKNGSGLGLSIAKKVIQTNLNGEISCENIDEPQQGVKFSLSFGSEYCD